MTVCHTGVVSAESRKRLSDSLELELYQAVNCPPQVLGAEFRSSARAAGALIHWAKPLALSVVFFVFSLNTYYSCAYPLNMDTPITQQNTPENKDRKRRRKAVTRDAVQRLNESLSCVRAYVLSLVIWRETKVNFVKSLTTKCYVFSLNVFS